MRGSGIGDRGSVSGERIDQDGSWIGAFEPCLVGRAPLISLDNTLGVDYIPYILYIYVSTYYKGY